MSIYQQYFMSRALSDILFQLKREEGAAELVIYKERNLNFKLEKPRKIFFWGGRFRELFATPSMKHLMGTVQYIYFYISRYIYIYIYIYTRIHYWIVHSLLCR